MLEASTLIPSRHNLKQKSNSYKSWQECSNRCLHTSVGNRKQDSDFGIHLSQFREAKQKLGVVVQPYRSSTTRLRQEEEEFRNQLGYTAACCLIKPKRLNTNFCRSTITFLHMQLRIKLNLYKNLDHWAVVVHTFKPRTQEAKAGPSL